MALVLTWLDRFFGAADSWVSAKSDVTTTDATVTVLAEYAEPASQKTEGYRVAVSCEETPVNNDAAALVLTRSFRNASGVVSAIHATIVDGGATVSPPSAAIEYNATTKKVEVRVTGIAARNFRWRAARIETA